MTAPLDSTPTSPSVLALDLGSSSVRAGLFDTQARPLAGAQVRLPLALAVGGDGRAEIAPPVVLDLCGRAIDQVLARAGTAGGSIAAVAASTFWHGLCGIDAAGAPTTPILTWADRRAAPAAAALRARLSEPAVHQRTGCLLHASTWPAKLAWLAQTAPETFARTARWISPGELLYGELFGHAHAGTSMASATGLYDQARQAWDDELVRVLGLRAGALSTVSNQPQVGLRAAFARRWPALAEVPWLPAWGDGACSNVGAGCMSRDRMALMIGTSGALRVLFAPEPGEAPPVPEGLFCYRADPRRLVVGGALSEGGNVVAWLRRTLALPPAAEAEAQLSAAEADAHGLTMLPLFAGERAPGWHAEARAAILGLQLSTRPVEILRAALEAVALRFALVAERLGAALGGVGEIVATGAGLLASPAWIQIVADALGAPVVASAVEEASSRGAALLALEALGLLADAARVPAPLGRRFAPDAARHARYQEARRRQQALYAWQRGG